ncbi:uncharacterized protein [Physcomitrium patens]|uniref:Uncharacterized protein n=1 Tax=Physcomitrium patens TaxID=3218 RepID=A0A2K1KEX7_PHYPA|nr:uncharacterized protein LOC112284081 [Physcomitrium patens]XP_024379370.1 uncharacterized protein LOC112284081 [Physcomitrium patens]PNR52328.1 hypothetical protein PHYPA_008702 [Physcomitrium patens]|eukprot:XP_024379369.1 uncharacterized protein LOC112284081 [Physcomitrella patens]
MAVNFAELSAACCASTSRFAGRGVGECVRVGAVKPLLCSQGGVVVLNSLQNRGKVGFCEVAIARIGRGEATLKGGVRRRSGSVHGLASDRRSIVDDDNSSAKVEDASKGKDFSQGASSVTLMSEEDAKAAVVSEVTLKGDKFNITEYPDKEEAQPDAHPVNSLADSVLNLISDDRREFSLTEVGGLWKTGDDAGAVSIPEFSDSAFDEKDGVSPLDEFTTTELTMEHAQLARITTDIWYLQNAFAFFGAVRATEALMSVFSTSPPDFGKLSELLNALDPFTISWLAYNVHEPMEELTMVDPSDLEKVLNLRTTLWDALHNFYERQWKVMATLAVVRLFTLINSYIPSAEEITGKVKFLWDALMALPVF